MTKKHERIIIMHITYEDGDAKDEPFWLYLDKPNCTHVIFEDDECFTNDSLGVNKVNHKNIKIKIHDIDPYRGALV